MNNTHNKNNSWISKVLDAISGAFTKTIGAVKKHGVSTALWSLLIISFLWSVILNPIKIGDIVDNQLKLHSENEKIEKDLMIERRYEANEVIGDIMSKLVARFNCNRVLLLEKHNSIQSLGNVDFLYLSCSLEMLDHTNQDLDYISEELQRQMVVNLLGNDVIGLLKHSKYLFYDNLQDYRRTQCRLLNKLKNEGEKQCIIYPFSDSKHRPLLILVICGDDLNVDEIIDYIDGYSKQITDLLIFD